MGWIFALLLVGVLVFFVVESRTTRIAAVVTIGVIIAALTGFLIYSESGLQTSEIVSSEENSRAAREQRDRKEASLTAIKLGEVAFVGRSLEPVIREETANDGSTRQVQDLYRWRIGGKVINRNSERTLAEMFLRVRLYSCPSFFDTPQADVNRQILDGNCAPIGNRSYGLYNLDVAPNGEKQVAEQLVFDNQPEPRNWRYLITLERVTAKVE